MKFPHGRNGRTLHAGDSEKQDSRHDQSRAETPYARTVGRESEGQK